MVSRTSTRPQVDSAIGIARALIRDNPILILDEPTAALDAESEALVVEAMERLMRGRTVITIAHRLSTLRNADKIIVVKDGVVAEEGTHEELLNHDGVYAQLHHRRLPQPSPGAAIGRAFPLLASGLAARLH